MENAWEKLALVYHAKGDFEKSLAYWDQIRRAVNQHGKGVTGYAVMLALLGRKEEAFPYLEQLLRRDEQDPEVSPDKDERYWQLLERIGLKQYYEKERNA